MGGGSGFGVFSGTKGSVVNAPGNGTAFMTGRFQMVDTDFGLDWSGKSSNNSNWHLIEGKEVKMLAAGISAAKLLSRLKGKSESAISKILTKSGFTLDKQKGGDRNAEWKHPDGSIVKVHPYGSEKLGKPKNEANAHVHKVEPVDRKLDDRGLRTNSKKRNHIGIKNPNDYPSVRQRPHGYGVQSNSGTGNKATHHGGSQGKLSKPGAGGGVLLGGGSPFDIDESLLNKTPTKKKSPY